MDRARKPRSERGEPHCGNKGQSAYFGCRSEQTIDKRYGIGHAEERPGFGDWFIHRKDAVAEEVPQTHEPAFECHGLGGIFAPFQFDAAANFGEHQGAGSNFVRRRPRDPSSDVRMSSLLLTDLGDDIGIEQKSQRSTRRQLVCRG